MKKNGDSTSAKTKPIPRAEIASSAFGLLAMTGTSGEATIRPILAGSGGLIVQNKANFQVPEMSLTCGQKMGYDGKLLKEVLEKQSQFPGLGWFTRLHPVGQGPAGPRNAVVDCCDVRPTIVAVGCASSHDFFRRAGTLALLRNLAFVNPGPRRRRTFLREKTARALHLGRGVVK